MTRPYLVREIAGEHDVLEVQRLVRAHGDARSTTPGVEYVYADADRMPGPYIPPRGGIWLALASDVGIGCVALREIDEQSAEVKRMFVEDEWRGRGVGRTLLRELIDGARARGYSLLRLGTLADMNAAQALYRSLGFTPTERYRSDELVDTRFMVLALDQD